MREARITTSPVTEYCWRASEPMLPVTASPACRPMPMRMSGMRPASARPRTARSSSRAAASAFALSLPLGTGAPKVAMKPSPRNWLMTPWWRPTISTAAPNTAFW